VTSAQQEPVGTIAGAEPSATAVERRGIEHVPQDARWGNAAGLFCYDQAALLNERGGRYWRNGGFHWPAIVAQLLGMGAAAFWLNAYSPFVGYFAARHGGPFGSDFSVFIGLIVGGVVYWLLAGRAVRAEGAATPASADI
jgi:hypothetical protein